jgi:transcription initiation factor TFIIH subunit 2
MADSDYDFEEDASDDEYIASKATSSTRAQAPGKRKLQEKTRKPHAWESQSARQSPEYMVQVTEADDGTIQQSVKEREEDRKRKRLRKDTKPFQRGIIRHVVLVLDLSEAMLDKDMRPNRYHTMIKYTQEYVREFFEQNPISQMSVLGMHDGLCIRVTELSGNPADHMAAIEDLRKPRNPKDVAKEPKGSPSLQNALELSRATLYHTPNHGTREVIIVFGSLLSLDPGDIHQTIKACVHDRIRVSIIGMSARLKICTEIVSRTNAGDESEYVVATDQELLRELLLATTTPPVVRSDRKTPAPAQENAAALMMMGFPSRVVEDVPTMCACHGVLTTGGYTCSRCKAKVCSLPITCPSCQLTLLLSTHLARSYHHLFPLRNWAEVTWARAREKGTRECLGCQAPFPEPPTDNRQNEEEENGESNGNDGAVGQRLMDAEESEEQKASESSRYECRVCESHFCIDCDMFCHMVLHNCPGCLSQVNEPPGADTNGDVTMTG